LLSNYGGEQVCFCIDELDGVGEKIKLIGVPLVVKCTLNPSDLEAFYGYFWGKIAISTSHRSVNRKVHTVDLEGYQCNAVQLENLELYRKSKLPS
jgi:hypothetical protein